MFAGNMRGIFAVLVFVLLTVYANVALLDKVRIFCVCLCKNGYPLTLEALNYFCIDLGDKRVIFNLTLS